MRCREREEGERREGAEGERGKGEEGEGGEVLGHGTGQHETKM